MTQEHSIPVFDWFSNQFTVQARAGFLEQHGPLLVSLFQAGDRVLDLGCGAGAIAFFLEEHGADVTGIDLAPGLVTLAREEATRRRSQARFIHGNVLTHPLGEEEFDLAICMGNPISDFPQQDFPRFRDNVHRALKPGGRLVVEYRDGVLRTMAMSQPQVVVEEGAEGQIERRFKAYDPVRGALVCEYRHLATGDFFEGASYVYTGPIIRLLLEDRFEFQQSTRLGTNNFLDLFVKA
jgi:SAM-dependent methyltransferase